jgi:hypothetical protein
VQALKPATAQNPLVPFGDSEEARIIDNGLKCLLLKTTPQQEQKSTTAKKIKQPPIDLLHLSRFPWRAWKRFKGNKM